VIQFTNMGEDHSGSTLTEGKTTYTLEVKTDGTKKPIHTTMLRAVLLQPTYS
jgi:hypothetical protein